MFNLNKYFMRPQLKLQPKVKQKLSLRTKLIIASAFTIVIATIAGIIFFIYSSLGTSEKAMASANGDYRTKQNGNWNAASTWEQFNGTSWVTPSLAPSSTDGVITILSGHTVTLTSNVTADQVVVNSGGQITLNNNVTLTIANGTGSDLDVTGTIRVNDNSKVAENSGVAAVFNANSIFEVNWTSTALPVGVIPTAIWDAASTVKIIGFTTVVGNSDFGQLQRLGNVIYNCPNQTSIFNLYYTFMSNDVIGDVSLKGSFTVISTGTGSLQIGTVTASNQVINGNLTIQGGTLTSTNSGNRTLNVLGDFSMTGGTWHFSDGGGNYTLNVAGDFTFTGGTIDKSSTGVCSIVFNGVGTQTNLSGGSFSTAVNFTVNSGCVLDMGTSVLNGSGTFTLSSGGELKIGSAAGITTSGATGNIQVTGTRAYSTGANYTYNGSSVQVTGNGFPTGTITGNITISNAGGVTPTNNIVCNGTLSVNGLLTPTSNQVISGTGTLTGTGTVQVTKTGNATNDFTAQYSISNKTLTNLTVEFKGASAQNSNTATYYNLKINNASGLTIGATTAVNTLLTLTSGKITTGIYEVNIANNSTSAITGYSSSNYIVGSLRRAIANSGNFDYPVGTSTNYELATVTPHTLLTTTNIVVSFSSSILGTSIGTLPVSIAGLSISQLLNGGIWTITPNIVPTGGTYDVTLSQRGYSNGTGNGALYAIVKRPTSLLPWVGLGTPTIGSQSQSGGTVTAVSTGFTSFSDFGIGRGGFGMPIELTFFKAEAGNNLVNLTWQTASELNNAEFIIERSVDGTSFDEITKEDGAGTTNEASDYSTTDENPLSGVSYYRLKQVDYDGNFTYSNIQMVNMGEAMAASVSVFPNPSKGIFNVTVSNASENAYIRVFTMNGSLIKEEPVQQGSNMVVDLTGMIPGTYLLRVGDGGTNDLVKQLILSH